MNGWLRFILIAFAIVTVLCILGGGGAWWAIHTVPAEYEQVRHRPVAEHKASGAELERHASNLSNKARQQGQWQGVFTQDQINGWLAVDLPEKFPDEIPEQFSEPRITLSPDRARVYCRYNDGTADTILSLDVSIYLTGEPNEIAIRLRGACAGTLPIPVGEVVERITEEARSTQLRLRWSQAEGDPVALVSIPPEELADGKIVLLDKLEIRDKEIFLSGLTSRPPSK